MIIGHSAGSMAALVAGVNADATVAVLGLDPVAPREGNLDEQAADLEGMLAAIAGDPSQCNSNNSGVAIYQRGSAQTLSVAQATHCDFEAPSNFLCTATCGGTGGPTVEATVRQLVTAYAAWKLGLDEAASWWDPTSLQPHRGQVSKLRKPSRAGGPSLRRSVHRYRRRLRCTGSSRAPQNRSASLGRRTASGRCLVDRWPRRCCSNCTERGLRRWLRACPLGRLLAHRGSPRAGRQGLTRAPPPWRRRSRQRLEQPCYRRCDR